MKGAKIFVSTIALVLLGFGIASLFWTQSIIGAAGISTVNATGISELRAFYGGLEIGLGIALGAAVAGRWSLRTALMLIAVIFGCVGIARIGSAITLGDTSTWTVVGSVFEAGASLMALWFMRATAVPSPSASK